MRAAPRASAWLAFTVGIALASPASGQEKYAVVIGVNDYVHYDGIEDGDLRGAERDALVMRGVLVQRWGIPEENVRTLLSLNATKSAIREAVTEWAAQRVREGDLFVFYFAGHGSQAIDLDGDEPDGLDETIAPTDVDRFSSELDIRDDELAEWLGAVDGDAVVIFDSCHSGSATRATGNMLPRVLNRELPDEGVRARDIRTGGDDTPQNMSDGSRTLVELAAASPSQSAMEGFFHTSSGAPPVPGGAFTYHLVQQLWRAPPQATYEDLMRQVVTAMKSAHFTQDPQLEGPTGSNLFATRAAPSPQPASASDRVQIQGVDGPSVALAGGEDRGVTPGSVYESETGALLRVTRVDVATAEATVVGGVPIRGEWASLVRVALPPSTLEVGVSYLPASTLPTLEAALEGIDGVTLTADPDVYPELFLRPSEDDLAIEVLGRDGGVRSRVTRGAGLAATFRGVAGIVRKELSVKRLARLDNPAAPFRVELSLRGGSRVFQEGDTISFSVRSERSGYLTLVDLGMDGTVTVLHPNPYENFGRLGAGATVTVPGDWAVFTVTEETGLGLVRAIITPEPLGLSVGDDLIQDPEGLGLAEEIRSLLEGEEGGIRATEWATALAVYEVVEGR